MKFLIMLPKPRKTAKARAKQAMRIFLEDGTELTQVIRAELSPELQDVYFDSTSRFPCAKRYVGIRELTLTFSFPEVEKITTAPKKAKP